jgi:pimeloyl-ACP methyl ester carboxylesterase
MSILPITRYAKSGDVHVAYQVFGDGPVNLVLAPPFVSNIENYWEEPDFSRWLLRLASYARIVMLDKRGTGLSDRVSELPGLGERIDDVRAVLDAADIEQAALLGMSEGGPLTALFAATYPDRCRALVLYGTFARFASWLPTPEALRPSWAISMKPGAVEVAFPSLRHRANTIRLSNSGGAGLSDLALARPPPTPSCA